MQEPRQIPLSDGTFALVDEADYERLAALKWSCAKGYPRRKVGARLVQMARFVIDVPEGMVPDHINGNPRDNRRANLRPATPQENIRNRRTRGGKTGFKGVRYLPATGKYTATIFCEGRHVYSANFATAIGAALAYDAMAREFYGEFAAPNFPDYVIPWEWRAGSTDRARPRFRALVTNRGLRAVYPELNGRASTLSREASA